MLRLVPAVKSRHASCGELLLTDSDRTHDPCSLLPLRHAARHLRCEQTPPLCWQRGRDTGASIQPCCPAAFILCGDHMAIAADIDTPAPLSLQHMVLRSRRPSKSALLSPSARVATRLHRHNQVPERRAHSPFRSFSASTLTSSTSRRSSSRQRASWRSRSRRCDIIITAVHSATGTPPSDVLLGPTRAAICYSLRCCRWSPPSVTT